jgi:excisionase family DNA binding protein
MSKVNHPKCTSIAGAAELLGVERQTIERLIKAGKLRASHVGRRVVIRLADLDKLLAENEVAA